ncbi:MAG TPA: sigma-70 family RNA polymerase sigma factor [Gemmataceae bacterium]|nr:sigma-70 family RNA polymerase sigma factor [Gemmataceae bacterium]
MAAHSSGNSLASLRLFLAAQTPSNISDRELLSRFLSRHDQAAFAALFHRHGAMVLSVCRRVLRNPHDAEDACQATFLILAQRAAAIRKRDALGSWLHGVAFRVARDLRAKLARRAACSLTDAANVAKPAEPESLTWEEVRGALDEELHRLPEHYRTALVLCYLEGRSRDEAAHQLGWSLPTLHGRLARGRALLHARMIRRGLTISAVFAGAFAHDCMARAVPARLFLQTIRAATSPALGGTIAVSPQVTVLVKGALSAMIRLKLKYCIASVALLLGIGGYAAFHFYSAEAPPQAWTAALTPEEVRAEETVELSGQVLDPDGRPFAGAELSLVARWDSPLNGGSPRTSSGPDGRFTLAAPKSELARHLAAARPVDVLAVAKGFGLAWRSVADFLPKHERDKVNPFARLEAGFLGSAAVLKLARDDFPLTGRIETPEGKPVVGADVRLETVYANDANDLTAWLAAIGRKENFGSAHKYVPHEVHSEGLGCFLATTDAQGRFRLTGIGSNRLVELRLSGPGLAAATILARTQPGLRLDIPNASQALGWFSTETHGCFGADFALSAGPARSIHGVVRDADTGQPIPGAIVQSHRLAGNGLTGLAVFRTRADAQGCYRLDGMPTGKGNALLARGPDDQPYLAGVAEVETSTGDGPVELDLKLKRGLWAEGRVTDADTGRPLAADVVYYCLESNPRGAETPGFTGAILGPASYHTNGTGQFRVPVLPGPGMVAAMLHGQRSWTILSKLSSTWQAGKSYIEYRGRFDPPDAPAAQGGWFVVARPCSFVVVNYHQIAVIHPTEQTTSFVCDLPVYADGSPLRLVQKREGD